MTQTIPTHDEIANSYSQCSSQEQLDKLYDTYLGKHGILTAMFKTIGSFSPEEKKTVWSQLSDLKQHINSLHIHHSRQLKAATINTQLTSELVDIYSIWINNHTWHYHLLTQVRHQVEYIFTRLGFTIEYGNEVVSKYENFESLNIPLTHPATEMHDTYYLTQSDHTGQNLVLRTHTSAMQQRIIKQYWPEFKCIIPWKVYRCESTDVSHDTMFWQLEWMVVWPNVSIPDFKWLMQQFFSELFQTQVSVRLRPSYFPFTEPSFEMDVSCTPDQPELYKLSKETWRLEIWWAGMIHPEVLSMAGIDPNLYSWFAFGMWLTRMAAIKHQIRDIRYFTNGDLRFIQSF